MGADGVASNPADLEAPVPVTGRPYADADWRSRVVSRSLAGASTKAVDRATTIIAAAKNLIQRSHDQDFTMQRVATEAGVSLGVVYQLFSGKDDLLVAVLEDSNLAWSRLLERHAARRSDPLEKLGAVLYFATDPRQHATDPAYHAGTARFGVSTSLAVPDEVGQSRRPIVHVYTRLVEAAMLAGQLERGNPQLAAAHLLLASISYATNLYAGNSTGAPLPSTEQFLRFCLCGLGAELPRGWEAQFALTDEEAERSRRESLEFVNAKSPRS